MNTQTHFEAVSLEGQHLRLEPISYEHKDALCEAIRDGELWNIFVTSVPHPDTINTFIDDALRAHKNGDGLCFATIDKASNKVVGSTRFMHADLANKRCEIGFTFIAKSFQRTYINTEAKRLMLGHAFEVLKLNRVEFLTDYLNTASRDAILRLGAVQEGVLRSHKVMPNGRIRDSVIFSITNTEWPDVKAHLDSKL